MNREEFLRELEDLLSDVPAEDREEALDYYRDYFDEAGPEQEAEILSHLGSPGKVAAEIKSGLSGDEGQGEFTERGYYDARFGVDYRAPDQYTEIVKSERAAKHGSGPGEEGRFGAGHGAWRERRSHAKAERGRWRETGTEQESAKGAVRKQKQGHNRRGGLLLLLLVIFFGIPAAGTVISAGFSVIAALAGALLGIFGGLFSLVVGAFALACGLLAVGISMIAAGFWNMAVPAVGLMAVALGFLALAGAMLLFVAAKWACTTAVPGVFRFSVEMIRRFCGWVAGLVRRLFGRGGADR